MSFPRLVERWRPLIAKHAGGELDVEFLLRWIQCESGGRSTVRTRLDERGIFQVHPDEATTIELNNADFDRLLCGEPSNADGEHQAVVGTKLVRRHRARANFYLARAGVNSGFQGKDLDCMTKLVHVLPRLAKEAPKWYQTDKKIAPPTWTEMVTHARDLARAADNRLVWLSRYDILAPATPLGGFLRLIRNAAKVGGISLPPRGPTAVSAAIAATMPAQKLVDQ